jgi:hypothetical protein
MSDVQDEQPEAQAAPGSTTGQSVHPEAAPPLPEKSPPHVIREVPIGTPVSQEELKRLKAEAEKPSADTQATMAQADEAQEDAEAP